MSVHDDEEDFELSDDSEEPLEEEMEEEEEEESIMQSSDESDTPTNTSKSKSKPKSKPKPKPVQEAIIPLIDFKRIQRKKRIFTQDQFDVTYQKQATPVCKLCNKKEDEVVGGFISPYPVIYKNERFFVHKACVLCSMDTARSSFSFYNVVKSINAGKKIRCRACGQYGVTFWCQVSGCPK